MWKRKNIQNFCWGINYITINYIVYITISSAGLTTRIRSSYHYVLRALDVWVIKMTTLLKYLFMVLFFLTLQRDNSYFAFQVSCTNFFSISKPPISSNMTQYQSIWGYFIKLILGNLRFFLYSTLYQVV